MTTDPLRLAEAQLQRYWNVDGLNEIAVALISGLTGLWVWSTDVSNLPHAWKSAFSATFPVLIMGGMWMAGLIIKRIRRTLTYPRVGFAELRRPPRWRTMLLGAIAACIAAGVAVSIRRVEPEQLRTWAVLLPGIASGIFLWQIGSRAGLLRFQALAAVLTLAAIAIAMAGFSFEIGMIVFWFTASAALLVSGGVTLWRFLHTTLPPED
jgi:hypothetical protein